MNTLPTREEAELADEFDSALWSDEWEMAADLVKARADGTLQTAQEFRDSLDIDEMKSALTTMLGDDEDEDWISAACHTLIAAALGDSG